MKSRVLFFAVILTSIGFSGLAQKTLKGIVVDSITLNAIPNASIRILGLNYGTVTNQNGVFSIKVKATDTLIFSSIGYLRQMEAVNFDDEIMFVRMIQDVILLKEVTVFGRPEADKQELPSLKIKSKAVPWYGAIPSSGMGTSVNLDFFSKREREKRKLEKIKVELASTQVYVDLVTSPQVKQELKDRFSLSDSVFYQIITHFNEQHREITHSGQQSEILNSLFSFFEAEVRFRRFRQ